MIAFLEAPFIKNDALDPRKIQAEWYATNTQPCENYYMGLWTKHHKLEWMINENFKSMFFFQKVLVKEVARSA